MKTIKVAHYDAFSSIPGKGNPAGVVLDSAGLSDEEMRLVAEKVGFNETVYCMSSEKADLRLRYFTPGHEINLCGHATMAIIYALHTKDLLDRREHITIETKAGILDIGIMKRADEEVQITMRQAEPEFKPFQGSAADLAEAMGLEVSDLDSELPIVYGSTGTWTLLVPVRKLDAFGRMKPENRLFPDILTENPRCSVHPFCLETYDSTAHLHGRHFSSPYSGTVEDPVTGTASGVMGAYYAAYIQPQISGTLQLTVEQGQEIGRDGRVYVTVAENGRKVSVRGTAVYTDEFEVTL